MRDLRGSTAIARVALVALVSSACDSGEGPPDGGMELRQTVVELRQTPERSLDLLLVVDDSPGMLEAQLNLAEGLPGFFDRLAGAPGGLPDLHVGVVSTDMGTKASGSGMPAPPIGQTGNGGCSSFGKGGELQLGTAQQVTGRFAIDVAQAGGGRMTNYTGTLAETVGQMVRLGAGGCGFEQPLAAMRAALGGQAANTGFLRQDALLGVVFLADEDDCSAQSATLFSPASPALGALQSFRCTRFGVTCEDGGRTADDMSQPGEKGRCGVNASSALIDDIAPYREFLTGLKLDERRVVVAGIAAPAEPLAVELRAPPGGGTPEPGLAHACTFTSPFGLVVADPAVRLRSFLGGFRDRSAASTICQEDLSGGLREIGNVLLRAMGHPCVEVPLADVDRSTEGLQADCVVEDELGDVRLPIDACEARPDARPCWQLEVDPVACGASPPPHLELVVQRDTQPHPQTVTRMRCRVAP
ncbi:MAG TPA: hypothetical protein VK932_14530 [Kofleriaceae bacterium]|nr:hypothetical protein [Kofleriaceae bacterium]